MNPLNGISTLDNNASTVNQYISTHPMSVDHVHGMFSTIERQRTHAPSVDSLDRISLATLYRAQHKVDHVVKNTKHS